jgi:ChpA-C
MRQILSRSLLTVAATSSILAVTGVGASADSEAHGGAVGSPGVLSGNSVQAPVDIPVNACGNTVDAVALGNPAFGNACTNVSHDHRTDPSGPAGPGPDGPDGSGAVGEQIAKGSPGVLSGNTVDVPVQAQINACGNSVDVVGLVNPAMGNSCANASESSSLSAPPPHALPLPRQESAPLSAAPLESTDAQPRTTAAEAPAQTTEQASDQGTDPMLAQTGFDSREAGAAGATSVALLLGGAILYRRGTRGVRAARAASLQQ